MSMMWVGIGSAVVGAGTSIYSASQAGKQGAAPPPRNLGNELSQISGAVPGFNQQGFNNQLQFNGQLTDLNQNNFNRAMMGQFDSGAFNAANPGFSQFMSDAQAQGQMQGWTPQQMAAAYGGLNANDPSLNRYNTGGFGQNLRAAYDQANPGMASYTSQLGRTMDTLNAQAPGNVSPSGYFASQSSATEPTMTTNSQSFAAQMGERPAASNFGQNLSAPMNISDPTRARDVNAQMVRADTGYDRVQANTGFDRVQARQGDIGLSSATQRMLTGGPSDIQQTLEQQARSDLALGGSLNQEQVRNSQQAAREAGAARGLINSNSTVAQEILNRDAASNARLNERRGFAAAVDQKGFGERQQGFANALGVSNAFQNYGAQNLSAQQSNLGAQMQGNSLNLQGQMANQGARQASNALGLQGQMANQDASLRAGLANQGADLALNNQRFQVGQANQSAGLENSRLGLGYAQLNNQANQANADRFQQGSQFNANLGQQNSQFNAGQANTMGQFNAQLGQQNRQYNTTANNAANQFNAGASNQFNMFNAQQQAQNNNDAWSRAMGFGQFQAQQAINPMQYYGLIQGNAPDYTNALLGYGQDLNNTNYNGQAAANISQRNNSSAMMGAGLGLVGNAAQAAGSYYGSAGRSAGTTPYVNQQNGGINPATGQPWG